MPRTCLARFKQPWHHERVSPCCPSTMTLVKNWRALLALCLSLLVALPLVCQSAPVIVVYPQSESPNDQRYQFDWVILRQALERTSDTYGPYELRPSPTAMPPQRVTYDMDDPQGVLSVFARASSAELEQKFLPIRIPIDRGLLGYRIFLIRKDHAQHFANVKTLDDLKALTIGQGKGWTDVQILTAAGLKVVEGSNYEGLFAMLDAERFDAFSRAFEEAIPEYAQRRSAFPSLAIESKVLLVYPLARYFFLRRTPEGMQLAKRIETGMEMMIRDGSYQTLFRQYKQALIQQADLAHRHIIQIPNPRLSPETPLNRRELWYDPLTDK